MRVRVRVRVGARGVGGSGVGWNSGVWVVGGVVEGV